MRFEVPQFIDIEDKIFGPLTWRQFLYLGGGLGILVTSFLTFGFLGGVLIGLPLGLLGGALAFYPVNNRPFSFFLEAIINYTKSVKFYIWQQKRDVVYKSNKKLLLEKTKELPSAKMSIDTQTTMPLARRLELEAMQKTE